MLRSIGKTCFAAVYSLTYAAYGRSRRSTPQATSPFIICYHRVVENFGRSAETAIPSLLISTSMLERHIDWLAKRYKIVSLDEIGKQLEANGPVHRLLAAITFDDGYADVYHNALPLLKRKGVPAGVFVVTDLVGTGRPQVFDRLYLLLRVLQEKGLPLAHTIECAAHSIDVRLDLNALNEAQNEPFSLMTLLLKALPRRDVETIMTALEQSRVVDNATLQECAPLTWEMIETM